MESAVLTFESVGEILWCGHSNETSAICFSIFNKTFFLNLIFGTITSYNPLKRV